MESTKNLNNVAGKRKQSEWPERMTKNELRQYIDGCHLARDYDSYFEVAVREWNNRYRHA